MVMRPRLSRCRDLSVTTGNRSGPRGCPRGATPRIPPLCCPGGATPRIPPLCCPGGATPWIPPLCCPGGATPRIPPQAHRGPAHPDARPRGGFPDLNIVGEFGDDREAEARRLPRVGDLHL